MNIFYLQCILLAVTLVSIYVCLKWYKFPMISKQEDEINNPEDHQKWVKKQNLYRFMILVIAILIDLYGYFEINYNGAGYLAIMLLLCIPFVFTKREK